MPPDRRQADLTSTDHLDGFDGVIFANVTASLQLLPFLAKRHKAWDDPVGMLEYRSRLSIGS